MNFFRFITQDWQANRQNTKGKYVAFLFRVANYATISRSGRVVLVPYQVFYRVVIEWILGIELPYNVSVGPGLRIYHGQALIVHKDTVIGQQCLLRQSTTIGNDGKTGGCPVIGDRVNIGANACIIGPVIIGNDVVIGAGSVVTKSIPPNSVVVGNPARIIRQIHPSFHTLTNALCAV